MYFPLCFNSVFTDGEVNILLLLLHGLQLALMRRQPATNSSSLLGSEVQWEELLFLIELLEILPRLVVHNS